MIGIDLVKISRMEKLYKRFGERGLHRFLHKEEIELCNGRVESISGFYAAKEAISKALGVGISKEISFLDIKIYKTKKGAPYFTLPKSIIDFYQIKRTSISITHEKEFAIAVAYLESNSKENFHPLFHL